MRAGVAFTALDETRLLQGQPVFHVTVPHDTAFGSWRILRAWVGQTGFRPVITHPAGQSPLDALYSTPFMSQVDTGHWVAQPDPSEPGHSAVHCTQRSSRERQGARPNTLCA